MEYKINNINCSFEEYLTNLYLEELEEKGILCEIEYQPKPFTLTDSYEKSFFKINKKGKKIKYKKQNLLNKHIYTPDFKVMFDMISNGVNKLFQNIQNYEINLDIPFIGKDLFSKGEVYIEVKSNFDSQNMTRMFTSHIQPQVFEKHAVYVNLVKPFDLFKQTFIPSKAMEFMYYKKPTINNKVGDKKFNFEYKTFNQFLNK